MKAITAGLKVSGALRMTAVAIQFHYVTFAFADYATIFAISLPYTTTRRVVARLFLLCHDFLLKLILRFGRLD